MSLYVSEIALYVGRRRTGKSFTARAEFEVKLAERKAKGLRSRAFVVDPMREVALQGETRVRTRADMLEAMLYDRYPLVMEETDIEWTGIDKIPDLVGYFDEAHRIFKSKELDPAIDRLVRECGHTRTDLFLATQRPADLAPVCWDNATRAALFPLTSAGARRAVEEGLEIELPPPDGWEPVLDDKGKRIGKAVRPIRWEG